MVYPQLVSVTLPKSFKVTLLIARVGLAAAEPTRYYMRNQPTQKCAWISRVSVLGFHC